MKQENYFNKFHHIGENVGLFSSDLIRVEDVKPANTKENQGLKGNMKSIDAVVGETKKIECVAVRNSRRNEVSIDRMEATIL